jgi:hypothetical protein
MKNEINNNPEKTEAPLKKGAAFQKIAHFAKYHNGFVIGLVLALLGATAIFAADPEAREAVLGKEIVTESGVDNSALLAALLDDFDFGMTVENVTEDDGNYYIDYSFNTYQIQDNVWQIAPRHSLMKIDKLSLAGGDLGLYLQKQLSEIVQNELAYLKEVQTAEREKGPTRMVKTTEYTGLIGLVLDAKNAVLPGYDPVVKPAPVELAQDDEPPLLPETEPTEENKESESQPEKTDTGGNPPAAGGGSGAGGSANNQPSSGNATTTEEAAVPAPEPSETSETLEPSGTEPVDSEPSQPSESPETHETPESSETSESEPVDPEPAPEPEPEIESSPTP